MGTVSDPIYKRVKSLITTHFDLKGWEDLNNHTDVAVPVICLCRYGATTPASKVIENK